MSDLISFVPPPSTTATTGAQSAATLSTNFDTFLTILTAQIQNQDPLEPMDSTQFTEQLHAFFAGHQIRGRDHQLLGGLAQGLEDVVGDAGFCEFTTGLAARAGVAGYELRRWRVAVRLSWAGSGDRFSGRAIHGRSGEMALRTSV